MKMAYPELQQQFDMNPYPSENEKTKLSEVTGLTHKQVDSWFISERQRLGCTKETMSDRYPELGKQFEINPYPDQTDIDNLVTSTGLTKQQINNWFQKQRKKNGLPSKKPRLAARYPQLEEQFGKNPHPEESDVSRLIKVTGLSRGALYDWFKRNQRRKGLNGPVFGKSFERSSMGKI